VRLRVAGGDGPALEARARALAEGRAAEAETERVAAVVFRLAGRPCALPASAVERAVTALESPLAIPAAGGAPRAVVFVDDVPLAVADLAGRAAGREREPGALRGAPALVLAARGARAAVVVEGPVELAEEPVAARAGAEGLGEDDLRVVAILGSGVPLLDEAALAAWVARTTAP
jgi:hypothetical protein